MRYTTDDMRNYAGEPVLDFGVEFCIKEAADEIDRLRAALQKHAMLSHHRMAEGGGSVPSGFSCEICKVECGGKLSELRHKSDCPLFPLNAQR